MSESTDTGAVCRWPGDGLGRLSLNDDSMARHLSEDARVAQIIAIRYADGHDRPGTAIDATMEDYNNFRDKCLASLFQVIADQHHVTLQQVRESLNSHQPIAVDAIVILSFALVWAYFMSRVAKRIWERFPPADGLFSGIVATIVISLLASLLGDVLGEGWSRYTETLRIGYGHLNLRADRIPWAHHRELLFIAGLVVFWIVSLHRYRGARARQPSLSEVSTLFGPRD